MAEKTMRNENIKKVNDLTKGAIAQVLQDLTDTEQGVKAFKKLLEEKLKHIPEYKIELKVSDEELAKRKQEMIIKKKENLTGYLKRYSQMVSSADKGAIINR